MATYKDPKELTQPEIVEMLGYIAKSAQKDIETTHGETFAYERHAAIEDILMAVQEPGTLERWREAQSK